MQRLAVAGVGIRFRRSRFTSLLVQLLLVLGIGCQGELRDGKLTVITSISPAPLAVLYQELSSQAKEITPLSIDLVPVPEFTLKKSVLASSLAYRQQWDLAIVPAIWLPRLEQRKAILEVPSHHAQEFEAKLAPLARLAVRVGERPMAYPLAAEVPALFINPSLIPRFPGSLEEMGELSLPQGVLPLVLDLTNPSVALPLLESVTGSGRVPATSDLSHAFEHLRQQLANVLSTKESWELCLEPKGEKVFPQLFKEQRLAAFIGGPEALPLLKAHGVRFSVTSVPPPCSGCPAPQFWASFLCVVVSASCPYPDVAQELAFRLATSEANVLVNLALSTLPVLGGNENAKLAEKHLEFFGFFRALASARLIGDEQRRLDYEMTWAREIMVLAAKAGLQDFASQKSARQK